MKRFCSKCGTQIDDMKFCPNCGASADGNKPRIPSIDVSNISLQNVNLMSLVQKYIPVVLPIIYIFLLIGEWFVLSIPMMGEFSLPIYDMFSSAGDLANYIGDEAFGTVMWIVTAILMCIVLAGIYKSAYSVYCVFKQKQFDAYEKMGQASVTCAVLSGIVIVAVFIIQKAVQAEMDSSDFAMFSDTVSKIITTTNKPYILLILGIVGKKLSDRLYYLAWEAQKEQKADIK